MNPSPKSSVRATVRALLFAALLLGTPLSLLAANAGDPVATCGTITGNASCPTFQPDGGGLYLINDLGGFPAGTRVYIEGSFGSPCNEICLLLIPAPCVLVKVIRACDPPPETFEGCGTINGGEGCPTFLADTGTIYFLSDLGGLEPGTRTYVRGVFGNTCTPLCDLAAECIDVASLVPCGRGVGDFDGTGCTDIADFLYLLDAWGTHVDGTTIGIADFLSVLDNWQQGPACP